MTFYQDNHTTLYCMDFRQNKLPTESVQMVVTSPPYWGLRKYSGEQELIWGIKTNHDGTHELCIHEWNAGVIKHDNMRYRGESSIVGNNRNQDIHPGPEVQHGFCSLCGAWKGAYGLEPTPEMYVEHTIEILREIRRVLRKDGVVFWNIGDSYSGGNRVTDKVQSLAQGNVRDLPIEARPSRMMANHASIKPKDLCLIPFRVAIAAQDDGWWVRSIIIWNKPNPMPESVTDRPTESHEYILMLTKSSKYYWDQEAVRREYKQSSIDRADGSKVTTSNPDRPVGFTRTLSNGANLRSVWEFPTQPYPEAHFAVFPEKLPELCIKAATPEVGCCSKCGDPWERVIEKDFVGDNMGKRPDNPRYGIRGSGLARPQSDAGTTPSKTIGWQPTCKCNADKVPSVVLDPFSGAGTTLWVAKKLNRRAIGFEISEEYCQLAVERMRQQVMM